MTEVEQYAAEAAETRQRMKSAMDEIQRRLKPANIWAGAKEAARATGGAAVARAGAAATGLSPVALAAIGLAVAYVIWQRSKDDSPYAVGSFGDDDEYAAYAEGDSYVGGREGAAASRLARGWTQVRSGVTSAGERLGAAGDAVRSGIDSAAETVSDLASDAAERTGRSLRAAGRTASDATQAAGDLLESRPALVIGVGLAAGLLLGFLAGGRSSREDEIFDY